MTQMKRLVAALILGIFATFAVPAVASAHTDSSGTVNVYENNPNAPAPTVRRQVLIEFNYSAAYPTDTGSCMRTAHVGDWVTDTDLSSRLDMLASFDPPYLGPEEPMP